MYILRVVVAWRAGLAENRCLSRRHDGCTLLQRGEESLGFGIKFSATVVLQIQEHASGLAPAACLDDREALSRSSSPNEGPLPSPRACTPGAPAMDISFRLKDGDFQVRPFPICAPKRTQIFQDAFNAGWSAS